MALQSSMCDLNSRYAAVSGHCGNRSSSSSSSSLGSSLGSRKYGRNSSIRLLAAESSSNSSLTTERKRINGLYEHSWWQEACSNLDASLQGVEATNLLQVLHEAARIFQIAMERNEFISKGSWLVDKWTGFDKKAWTKLIAYQVSAFTLLQAAMEVATRGEGRDRDVHVFVQRSLVHQCDPLEASIENLLSVRDPLAAEWKQQLPYAVASFVNIVEKDPRFAPVTSSGITAVSPGRQSDVDLLKLAISACAAVMKLGPATLSCPAFSSTLSEELGRLMNMHAELDPINEVHAFACSLGLRREFLSRFGIRGASNTHREEQERLFWVELCEQHLRNSLVREGVLSKLRPHDTAEALERDFAVFGFFAALGRKARKHLTGKHARQLEEPVSSLLRYLEAGAVLFYPQLSTLTYYQLYMEVVCEEMDWLPTFPKSSTGEADTSPIAVYTVLNVCSRWASDFLKYSAWVQSPSGLRVVDFLLKCQSRLINCREAMNIKDQNFTLESCSGDESAPALLEMQKQLRLFDEDLQNMEEALCKLESLLESTDKSEKLAAARKDLEKIRRLKQEAEALEACIKAKADGIVMESCPEFVPAGMSPEFIQNEKAYTDVFNKSIEKLKEASADLWRGTQLLGNDVAAATVLLKNGALGQPLTEREKKTLRRTFTDLASVIPIGFLMLLPVTAVGHAAMLAAIQKYVPALIPSAYAPERLDLLRQLEKVKQMDADTE